MPKSQKKQRQPVAIHFVSQNYYAEEPFRQVEYEIIFVERGNGTLYFGNSVAMIHTGDYIFINSFEEHYFRPDFEGEIFQCHRVLFDDSAFGSEDDSCRLFFEGIRLCRFLKMPPELDRRFLIINKMEKDSEGRELILKSLLFDIISYAVETGQYERFSQIQEIKKRKLSAIDNALRYIKDYYSENLSLELILQLTNYSKSHFIRLFKESTGMNVSEYINRYRIEKACLDLIYTSNNITEIATSNGFNNIQYFSRKFKEYMNCTPKQFQKRRKKLIERP